MTDEPKTVDELVIHMTNNHSTCSTGLACDFCDYRLNQSDGQYVLHAKGCVVVRLCPTVATWDGTND